MNTECYRRTAKPLDLAMKKEIDGYVDYVHRPLSVQHLVWPVKIAIESELDHLIGLEES